jgi:ParB/RepB/Spo0J family partition protein
MLVEIEIPLDAIRDHGHVDDMHDPVRVRPVGSGYYLLLAGSRSFAAARAEGRKTIPVVVATEDETETFIAGLIREIPREPLDRARTYARLLSETGLKQVELAKRLGKSQPFISNAMRLLDLAPDVQEALRTKTITVAHAKAFLALPKDEQAVFLARAVSMGWSSKRTEVEVRQHLHDDVSDEGEAMAKYVGEQRSMVERLRTLLRVLDDMRGTPEEQIVTRLAGIAALRAAPDLLALYDAIDTAAPLTLLAPESVARIDALARADEAMARLRTEAARPDFGISKG